jgi:hypothetical protein
VSLLAKRPFPLVRASGLPDRRTGKSWVLGKPPISSPLTSALPQRMRREKSIVRSYARLSTNCNSFRGDQERSGQLCQDYIENELRIDQSQSARPKAFPTVETYERHLINRIIPRWGRLAPLKVSPETTRFAAS